MRTLRTLGLDMPEHKDIDLGRLYSNLSNLRREALANSSWNEPVADSILEDYELQLAFLESTGIDTEIYGIRSTCGSPHGPGKPHSVIKVRDILSRLDAALANIGSRLSSQSGETDSMRSPDLRR